MSEQMPDLEAIRMKIARKRNSGYYFGLPAEEALLAEVDRLAARLAMFDAATSAGTERPSDGQGALGDATDPRGATNRPTAPGMTTLDLTAIHDYCHQED